MADLKDPRALYGKAVLFLVLGFLAGGLLLSQHFSWQSCALLTICVWAFCRCYYFVFYVIEHYVDPGYRFSGLIDFGKYLLRGGRRRAGQPREE